MNLKKMLAILLAAIMLLSLIPLTALAEGDEPTEDPAYTHPTEPEEPSTDPVDVGDPAEDPAEDPAQAGEELDNPRNLEGDEPGNEPVEEPIDVTSVTIDQPDQELTVGQSVQLTVTIAPDTATDQSIRWSSEDESVATVDQNGFVTAIAEGDASIKASSDSGHCGECLITVIAAEPTTPEVPQEPEPVEGYYLAGSFNAWAVQDAYQLTQNPADANEYMRLNVYLEAGVEVKGVKAEGGTITTYYPGLNNEPNYTVPTTGYYDVYLRPNGGGDGAWYYNCLLLAPVMRNITYTAAENGEVSGPAAAQVGSTVTVTATPADGYKLAYLDVTDADEAAVTVTGNTFVMPAKDVAVSATFVASNATTYAIWDEDSKTLSLYYGVAPEDAVVTGFGYSEVFQQGPLVAYRTATTVVFDSSFADARPTTLYYWFAYFNELTSIEHLSYLNTSLVTNMSFMFYGCYNLTELDVTHFDTSRVKELYGMFHLCRSLTTLDVTHFDTSKVTNMNAMFEGCSQLTELDVTHFDTGMVKLMSGVFSGCSKLTELDVTHFDTRNVTNMSSMFYDCSQLTELDLSHFDTSKVTDMYYMFAKSSKLHTIYADSAKWSNAAVTRSDGMFNNCPALVGGAGTVVSGSDYMTYTRIDEVGNPGYFTDIADKDRMNMGLSNDDIVLKQFYVDTIETTADKVVYAKLPKNSYPRFSPTSYPKLLDEQYAGYIFAGYFDRIGEGATAQRTATETTGYARFIPIEVLDVYVQFRHVSRAATNPESKTDLRFITSVPDTDTLGYNGALVGFKLLNVTDGFTISNHAFGTEYCYDEITGNYKVSDGAGGQVSLTPERFYAGISAKVALQTVIGMPNTYFDNQKTLSVQPYIITLDGTYSYATVHPFQLKYAEDGSKTAVPVA